MQLTVTRIYYNAAGEEVRADYIVMTQKRKSNIDSLNFSQMTSDAVIYQRRIKTTIFEISSDNTIASIDLIGNFMDRDSSAEKDWCTWDIPLDTIEDGIRDTKTIRCNMSDLKSIGETAI